MAEGVCLYSLRRASVRTVLWKWVLEVTNNYAPATLRTIPNRCPCIVRGVVCAVPADWIVFRFCLSLFRSNGRSHVLTGRCFVCSCDSMRLQTQRFGNIWWTRRSQENILILVVLMVTGWINGVRVLVACAWYVTTSVPRHHHLDALGILFRFSSLVVDAECLYKLYFVVYINSFCCLYKLPVAQKLCKYHTSWSLYKSAVLFI